MSTDLLAHLNEGRDAIEAIMTDRCRITKPGVGAKVFNETTGQYDEPPRVVVYEGKCRIQVKADINSNLVETTSGDHEWTYLTATLQIPIYAGAADTGDPGDVRPDNVAEMLSVAADDTLIGRVFNIQGIYHKSHATHRRWRIREVVG